LIRFDAVPVREPFAQWREARRGAVLQNHLAVMIDGGPRGVDYLVERERLRRGHPAREINGR
jgi:hypothetical protein